MKRLLMAMFSTYAAGAFAETWYWAPSAAGQEKTSNGTIIYPWKKAANWTNANPSVTASYPQYGDTAILGAGTSSSGPYNVCNSETALAVRNVFIGPKSIGTSQGNWVLLAGWGANAGRFTYDAASGSTSNWNGSYLVGEGEVIFDITHNVNYALQMRFLKKTTTQDPVAKPVLVKEGPGRFIFFNQAGSREYDIPLVLIRKGAIDFTNTRTLNGCSFAFDGDDPSQRLEFCYDKYSADIALKDGAIFETNGVANTTHGISADEDRQVIFTGTPKMNPMVFSGQFYGKAGLTWSPGSADFTFVCSNAVSATQGGVSVTKGTVKLVTGASFTNLARLSVAAGGTFRVDAGAGADFHADALELVSSGGTMPVVSPGEGVRIAVTAATLDGAALPPGTYGATAGENVKGASWVLGEGCVIVETGPANSDTWTGGAATTDVTADANWQRLSAPDFSSGDLLATFATGGTGAHLPASTVAKFDSLALASTFGGTAFAFTAGDGAYAEIGVNGLTAAAAENATTWTMGWPLRFAADQTWSLGANNTLRLVQPITGTDSLVLTGAGTFELAADNALTGNLLLESGTMRVLAGGGLGAASRRITTYYDQADLRFGGDIEVIAPIYGTWHKEDNCAGGLTLEENAHVTFASPVTMYCQSRLTLGAGSVARFTNGYETATSGMSSSICVYGSGTMIVTNKRLAVGHKFLTASDARPTLEFAVANCQLNSTSFWAEFPKAKLITRVPNAISAWQPWIYLGAEASLDLDGHDQSVDLLHGVAGSVVKSATPATLTVLSVGDGNNGHGGTARKNAAVFEGGAGLAKNGSFQHTLTSVNTSTGSVTVINGMLVFDTTASWTNASQVDVRNASTFKVKNAAAFGEKTVWRMASTATLDLDFVGTNRTDRLTVDGRRVPPGLYASAASGEGADYTPAWLSGTGRLFVKPRATAMILR